MDSPHPPITPNLDIQIPAPAPPEDQQKQKMKLIEKLVELDLGLHLVLGIIVILVGVLVFAFRDDIFNQVEKPPQLSNKISPSSEQNKVVIASGNSPIFINSQKVDIEKAFKGELPKTRLTVGGQLKREVFGFLPYWLIEKADKIDLRLVSAVSYFGLEVDSRGEIVKSGDGGVAEAWATWQNPKLDEFFKRAKKGKTKVYITLKNFSNENIEKLVNSPEASQNFIKNAMYLVNSKSLDGINIDFEYIGTPPEKVRDNFSILIHSLNTELKRQYPKASLSVCTFIDAASQTRLYDVTLLSQYSDALVIMGYDFHTPNSSNPGPVAPMEGYGNSITGLMASYLEKAPSSKLILAVPYYGYDWPVDSSGRVTGGRESVKAIPYGEIAEATKNTQIQWDENAKTPWYSYTEGGIRRMVHFENTRSLGVKYDFINQKNLQGVGVWALGFDGLQTDLVQLISDKFTKK